LLTNQIPLVMIETPAKSPTKLSKQEAYRSEVLHDYFLAVLSREASLLGRKEVLTGKAKFGILGDGKEVAQVAMARSFKKGDWRSGYYRDQTFMMAIGECSIEDYFSQLYADCENDPFSGGRQMNSHFATALLDEEGAWLDQTDRYNVSADISCTAGQMGRGLGLATASKVYRSIAEGRESMSQFTNNGNEICYVTIGDSSTSEGAFWECMNAATVERVPMIVAVWDDGYGISVPVEKQTTKGSISEALEGFHVNEKGEGMFIYTARGWNYPELCAAFDRAARMVRQDHRPALVHVQELTQPQGHSTSGSHERYKSKERLRWEQEHDCNDKMAQWILKNEIATAEELEEIKEKAVKQCRAAKRVAWDRVLAPIKESVAELKSIYKQISLPAVSKLSEELDRMINPLYSEVIQNAKRLRIMLTHNQQPIPAQLQAMIDQASELAEDRYHKHLYSETDQGAVRVPIVPPTYSDNPEKLNGYQIINRFFDKKFAEMPELVAFGEDVGHIGDVNQGFANMQEKYGESRVWDSGIREWSIMGQAIGLSMRGLRPIAEIQYLDYILYGLSPLSDDLATLRYRSNGIQKAPAIIRTRGHRLEGVWHAGSPLGLLINSLRGMHIIVPRNMVQAAGFYNTLLKSDDPGLVIECLNGYRLKEALPDNIGDYTIPLGVPEVLQEGTDVTLVTYGSCIREAEKGIALLEGTGVSVELIDAQTLLPFDLEGVIVESLKKTNRIIFMDEDFPGGATAYMMREVLEVQGGYYHLDAKPMTLTAHAHRPPFGSDGDYFSKPNPEDVYDAIMAVVTESGPV